MLLCFRHQKVLGNMSWVEGMLKHLIGKGEGGEGGQGGQSGP